MTDTFVHYKQPTMFFIGVTTGSSASVKLFPRWVAEMGIPAAQLVGVDIPIHADPSHYRAVVAQIRADPQLYGALVTTHKVDLYDAAADMFDEFDDYAARWREISCIVKQDGRLVGKAIDPITGGKALAEITGPGYWGRSGAHLLCLGGGGAAAALLGHLLTRDDQADIPRRIVVVNRTQPRLDLLRSVAAELPQVSDISYVANDDPRRNDELMAQLPAGSVVINATGMGKDRPGSPITDDGEFPVGGVAWDLNYRGELDFMRQARAQQERRDLVVEDGGRYFVISWTEHVRQIFHRTLSPEQLEKIYTLRP